MGPVLAWVSEADGGTEAAALRVGEPFGGAKEVISFHQPVCPAQFSICLMVCICTGIVLIL